MEIFNPFKEAVTLLAPKLPGRAVWNSGVRLDRAENPFPPSPFVKEALAKWATDANRYPEPDSAELRAQLSQYVGCEPSQLLIGNGSDELIDTISRSCLNTGDQIITLAPSFYFYHRSCSINGGTTVFVPTTLELELDVEAVLAAIRPTTRVVFIANPNNPTGIISSREVLERLIRDCPCLVIIDECYWEFSQLTVVDLIDRYRNLIVLRSLSKAFGLAGMRLGYAVGNEYLIERLYSAMQPFPVNGATQAVGIAALRDLSYMRSRVDYIKAQIIRLAEELKKLGFDCHTTATNFLLVESITLNLTATVIVGLLKARGIHVWDCTGSPGATEYQFRITAGTAEDNTLLLLTLKQILENRGD